MKILILPTFLLMETPIGLVISLINAKIKEVGKQNIVLLDIFTNKLCEYHELNPHGFKLRNDICCSKIKFISDNTGVPLTPLYTVKNSTKLSKIEENRLRTTCVGVIANYRKTSKVELFTNNELKQIENIFNNSVLLFQKLGSYIQDNSEISEIYTFNGRYPTSTVAVLIAQKLKISFFLYEAFFQVTPVLTKNLMFHSPEFNFQLAKTAYKKLNKENALSLVENYFNNRRKGQYYLKHDVNFTDKQITTKSSYFKSKGIKIASFPSSTFEYNFNPYGYKYTNQADELRDLAVNLIKYEIDFEMHIRLHPNLIRSPSAEIEEFVQLENDFNNKIKLHLPNSSTHTYDLIEQADYNIGFASFTMVEAAFFKKKVIQIGPSRYMLMKLGKHVKNGKEAAESIKNKSIKYNRNSQLSAIKWCSSFFINYTQMSNFSYDKNLRFRVGELLIDFTRYEKIILNVTGFVSALLSGRSETYFRFEYYIKRINSVIFKKSWF